jgi:hypothetical protein
MGAGISADGTRSHDRYFLAHAFLPGRFFRGENSVPTGLITTIEAWREHNPPFLHRLSGAHSRDPLALAPPLTAKPAPQIATTTGRSTLPIKLDAVDIR